MTIWPRKEQPRYSLDEQEPRTFRMPADLERQLADTMDDYSDEPLAPVRTAKDVADDIAHYKTKLAEGEEWLAKGKAELAELEAELAAKIGEEKAAHEAECAAKLAELEKLRAAAAGEQP